MARECGECSLCCKILDIPDLKKPAHIWCEHFAEGHGCSIYATRFDICRGYKCGWLLDESLGEEWRPLESGFIFHQVAGAKGIWLNIVPERPEAWRQEPYNTVIKGWAAAARTGSGYVGVIAGSKTYIIFPEEDLEVPARTVNCDLKVGYRHVAGLRRPLVMIRDKLGIVTEVLGKAILKTP